MSETANSGPEYRRILAELLTKFDGQTYKVGDTLPSLPQLELEYHASRGKIRHALTELRILGLIETEHGVGTRVVALNDDRRGTPEADQRIVDLIGETQDSFQQLAERVARIERALQLPPDPTIAPTEPEDPATR